MAPLNPAVPQVQDPNYIYWSREIQQPEANKAGQFGWSAAGEALETGAKGADLAVKQGIAGGLENELRPIGDKYTADLQYQYNLMTGAGVAKGGEGSTDPAMPADLKGLPDKLGNLAAAKANGALSETHYIGQIMQVMKDYRDRFPSPAYREFIDQTGERITGIKSANAQIRSLLTDINSFVSKKDEVKNKVLAELATGEFAGGSEMARMIEAGQKTPFEGVAWLEARRVPAAEARRQLAVIETRDKSRKDLADTMEGPVSKYIHHLGAENLDNITTLSGTKLSDIMDSVGRSDGPKIASAQWRQFGDMAKANMLATEKRMRDWMQNTKLDDGRSPYWVLGPEKAEKMIHDSLSMHRSWYEAITNQQTGYVMAHLNWAKDVVNDGMADVISEKDARRSAILLQTAHTFGGPNAWNWITSFRKDESVTSQGIAKALNEGTLKGLGQAIPEDLRPTTSGPPQYPFSTFIQRVSSAGGASPDSLASRIGARAAANLPSNAILSPQLEDQGKINIARMTFGDPNSLFKINKSMIGPDGRPIKGRDEYFAQWAQPAVSQEMKRLSQIDPTVYPMYKNWVERTSAILYRDLFGEINQMANAESMGLKWDSETHHLEPYQSPGAHRKNYGPYGGAPMNAELAVERIKPTIARLNSLFDTLIDVGKQAGEKDPDAYILRVLQQQGVDLSKISTKALSAIKASQYQDEQKDYTLGSLNRFIQNPNNTRPSGVAQRAASIGPINARDIVGVGEPIDIPKGMSARDFIQQLRREGRF